MSRQGRWEYMQAIYPRYQQARRGEKQRILDEFCRVTGYHRKSALRLLNGPVPARHPPPRRRRPPTYGSRVIQVLAASRRAAGYPWSLRLKALLPLWLPWARPRFRLTPALEAPRLRLSPRQMDRRLAPYRRPGRTGRYGGTKPGTLLKHPIPLRTDRWDVTVPGFTEIDLVAHSGESADGECAHSLTRTDLPTTWVEPRAGRGRSPVAVQQALEAMRTARPFALRGIDSDNGAEFLNAHLVRYCQHHGIQFTRGRPSQQDDTAHIAQQNGTHVRKLLGYGRYASPDAGAAMNALYRPELRLFQTLVLPSVKLLRKVRIGARIRRVYDRPQTPFERVCACPAADPLRVAQLRQVRAQRDPFALAEAIEAQLARLYTLAHHRAIPLQPARGKQAELSPASHRHRSKREAARVARPSGSRAAPVPPPASGRSRVPSQMARRSGGK